MSARNRIPSVLPPPCDFPFDVLKWMKRNAKPKMAFKLMQICKYFQLEEFPYFVVKGLNLRLDGGEWGYTPLPGISSPILDKRIPFPDQNFVFWITESLALSSFRQDNLTPLLPKIGVCNIKILKIKGASSITFEQFKALNAAGRVSSLTLQDTVIRDENYGGVPLENLFECLPNLRDLEISELFSTECFINIMLSHEQAATKMPRNLRSFKILNAYNNCQLEECFKFVQKNQQIKFTVQIDSGNPNSLTPPTVKKLQEYTDNLIKNWSIKYDPPEISFASRDLKQTDESIRKLAELKEKHRHFTHGGIFRKYRVIKVFRETKNRW